MKLQRHLCSDFSSHLLEPKTQNARFVFATQRTKSNARPRPILTHGHSSFFVCVWGGGGAPPHTHAPIRAAFGILFSTPPHIDETPPPLISNPNGYGGEVCGLGWVSPGIILVSVRCTLGGLSGQVHLPNIDKSWKQSFRLSLMTYFP